MFDWLANPNRFNRITEKIQPCILFITIITLISGLYFSLIDSPKDYQQGDAVRIMYVHVPSAWLASFLYFSLAISCVFYLVWKHPLADLVSSSIAPIGALFSALTLVTGSLWGKPMWGTWWVWDARLTSMLLLFFLYLAYASPHAALQVPNEELASYSTFDETPYTATRNYLPHPKPRAARAAMISNIDRSVGAIIDRLEKLGISDNTLIIFSSDNGPTPEGGGDMEFFDSNSMYRGYKRDLY